MTAEAEWLEAPGEGLGLEKGVGGLTGLTLWIGGVSALGLGTAMALGGSISPEVGWIATKLSRSGVSAGPVLACGAVVLGLAWVTRLQRRQNRRLGAVLGQSVTLGKLSTDFSGLRGNLSRVQLEFAEVLQTNRAILNVSRQQLAATEGEPQNDAMFRLAASMDQLGARLETRVRALFDSLEKRVVGIDARLDETAQIQRAEFLRLEERLTVAATLAQSAAAEIPYVDGAPAGAIETGMESEIPRAEETNTADGVQEHTEEEPVVELVPQEEWLEIVVELEEQGEEADALDEAPSLFDAGEGDTAVANDNWFEEATRNSGIECETEDLLDAGDVHRLSPAECAPVDTEEMLDQLDSIFGREDSVADVLENLRRDRGE